MLKCVKSEGLRNLVKVNKPKQNKKNCVSFWLHGFTPADARPKMWPRLSRQSAAADSNCKATLNDWTAKKTDPWRWAKSRTSTSRVVYCWTQIQRNVRALLRNPIPPVHDQNPSPLDQSCMGKRVRKQNWDGGRLLAFHLMPREFHKTSRYSDSIRNQTH